MDGMDRVMRRGVDLSEDISQYGVGGESHAVLVVEDDPDVRELAMEMVESSGFVCYGAPDARTALALLRRERSIHLMFTDILMPGGMNGIQLAEIARREVPELKVLFASGFAEPSVLDTLPRENCAFIRKPYHLDELGRRLHAFYAK